MVSDSESDATITLASRLAKQPQEPDGEERPDSQKEAAERYPHSPVGPLVAKLKCFRGLPNDLSLADIKPLVGSRAPSWLENLGRIGLERYH